MSVRQSPAAPSTFGDADFAIACQMWLSQKTVNGDAMHIAITASKTYTSHHNKPYLAYIHKANEPTSKPRNKTCCFPGQCI